jgi:hypothetical protein
MSFNAIIFLVELWTILEKMLKMKEAGNIHRKSEPQKVGSREGVKSSKIETTHPLVLKA